MSIVDVQSEERRYAEYSSSDESYSNRLNRCGIDGLETSMGPLKMIDIRWGEREYL